MLRAHDQAPREQPVAFPERTCKTAGCGKRFQPTAPAQKYCPRCRGYRVVDESKGQPKSESWWLNTTNREDFKQRAAAHETQMRESKEKNKVPDQILGERKTKGPWQ